VQTTGVSTADCFEMNDRRRSFEGQFPLGGTNSLPRANCLVADRRRLLIAYEAVASLELLPTWTMVPFVALVLGIATFPLALPRAWGRHDFQIAVTLLCAGPVAAYLAAHGHRDHLLDAAMSYASFVVTIGALYITASGIYVSGDIEARPETNVAFLLVGAVLASVIGTTGASILLIRPLLRTNRQRTRRLHIVPFYILAVSNAGGLLTPLGDPPLLLGYLEGVPFLWTLNLFPYWLLYVGAILVIFYVVERRAHAAEPAAAQEADRTDIEPLRILGTRNIPLLLGIVGAVLLRPGLREGAIALIAAVSYFGTPRPVHEKNGFSLGPIIEVAILFAGLFACLAPLEYNLGRSASGLPIHDAWQLFWASGILSSVLDNAPTYAAFSALARGASHGQAALVAGLTPVKLAAVSVGSVVMGATTYIGNGPNLMVKAIAERTGYVMPSFARYAIFAVAVLVPLHIVTTVAFVLLER
jgi:Na+/H+ antiporter NhaD/arsenite permease-like protein